MSDIARPLANLDSRIRWLRAPPSAAEPWLFGLLVGAGAGLLVLGVGGRVAMRAIAIANNAPTGFSLSGSATVVVLGMVAGLGGGLLYALVHRVIGRRRLARTALFATALVLLTLRGLRPIQPGALEWFMPLALAYGAIVDVAYSRWASRRAAGATGGPGA